MKNMEDKERLLKIQKDLEDGIIIEEDLSNEDVNALEELYNKQIELLKEMKDMYSDKLEFYKKNIKTNLEILDKLNKKN